MGVSHASAVAPEGVRGAHPGGRGEGLMIRRKRGSWAAPVRRGPRPAAPGCVPAPAAAPPGVAAPLPVSPRTMRLSISALQGGSFNSDYVLSQSLHACVMLVQQPVALCNRPPIASVTRQPPLVTARAPSANITFLPDGRPRRRRWRTGHPADAGARNQSHCEPKTSSFKPPEPAHLAAVLSGGMGGQGVLQPLALTALL